MNLRDLEALLVSSFQDSKLTKLEQKGINKILSQNGVGAEELNFVRNRAFEIVTHEFRQNESLDLEPLKWLKDIVKTIDSIQNIAFKNRSVGFFSPGSDCAEKIIELINQAVKSIDVCVFTISDDRISQALINAQKRNIVIRIITDNDKINDLGSDVERLSGSGIAVKIDRSPNHMHHKFAVFDSEQIINGSFNWTRSATYYNQENIVVSDDNALIRQFIDVFNKLWTECQTIS